MEKQVINNKAFWEEQAYIAKEIENENKMFDIMVEEEMLYQQRVHNRDMELEKEYISRNTFYQECAG